MGRFLRLFTDLPLTEIARLEQLKDAEINAAKHTLATEVTRLCHGDTAAREAAATAAGAFAGGDTTGLPTFVLPKAGVASVIDIAIALGMASSKGEARRLIQQGGVRVNDVVVNDVAAAITGTDLVNDGAARLSVGKKRHALIRSTDHQ